MGEVRLVKWEERWLEGRGKLRDQKNALYY